MPELPKGLRSRRRQTDGKLEIVGTNVAGKEYTARVCDTEHFTEKDAEILDIGNPEKRDANKFVGYYRDQRNKARRDWERGMDAEYTEAAEQVAHAGFHVTESTVGCITSRQARQNFDNWLRSLEVV